MKKIISLIIITMVIIITTTTIAYAMNFSDVVGNKWYTENLEYVTNPSKQIINGYPDGTFRPEKKLTIEEFITMIIKGEGIKYENKENEKWSKPYIEKAEEKYYIKNGQFTNYEKEITREEMAEIISNYLRYGEDVENSQKTYLVKPKIGDYNEIETDLRSGVLRSYYNGIITGYPDGTYKPKNSLTRAEGLTVIRRIVDKTSREEIEIDNELQTEADVTYHPETDTYEVDTEGIIGIEITDFTLKQIEEDHRVNFYIRIDVRSGDIELIEKQRELVKAFLDVKVGLELSNEIMEYVSTKENDLDHLGSKFYPWEGKKEVQVISKSGNDLITIRAWERTN